VKKYLVWICLSGLDFVAAQETVSLPLELASTGSRVSVPFVSDGSWQLQLLEGSVDAVFLYEAETGRTLRKLMNGVSIEQAGTFYVYVVAPDTANWRLVLGAPGAVVQPSTPQPSAPPQSVPEQTAVALPPVERRTNNNWARHFGYQVTRFTRSSEVTSDGCSSYAGDLEAQTAFIALGGPDLDQANLDPDGDGYACNYNPLNTSYATTVSCSAGEEWANPRYRRNGTYSSGGCRLTQSN
jgi:hypothetical protein